MEIVFTESSNISRVIFDRRNEDSGKKKPNEVIKEKRKIEKDEEDMRQEEDNGRGNGKWHDALCGPRVATHLSFFIRANHLRSKTTL